MRVQREMFESSLSSGASAMEALGHKPEQIDASIIKFREHNLALFETMHPHYKDRAKLIATVKRGREQLEEQMAQERALKVDNPANAQVPTDSLQLGN